MCPKKWISLEASFKKGAGGIQKGAAECLSGHFEVVGGSISWFEDTIMSFWVEKFVNVSFFSFVALLLSALLFFSSFSCFVLSAMLYSVLLNSALFCSASLLFSALLCSALLCSLLCFALLSALLCSYLVFFSSKPEGASVDFISGFVLQNVNECLAFDMYAKALQMLATLSELKLVLRFPLCSALCSALLCSALSALLCSALLSALLSVLLSSALNWYFVLQSRKELPLTSSQVSYCKMLINVWHLSCMLKHYGSSQLSAS